MAILSDWAWRFETPTRETTIFSNAELPLKRSSTPRIGPTVISFRRTYMKTLFSLAALSLAVNAASVTFRVVAPGANTVQVSVAGQSTTLTASDPDVPYYTGSANLDANVSYKYVVDGQAEPFDRTLSSSRNQTMNDFYGREVTYANLPKLPWPITTDPQWTRMGSKTPVFDDNYFPTIFITGDAAQVTNLVTNVPAEKIPVKYTFIGPEEVKVFNNCSFGVHHPGGKNNEAKQTWEWSLPEGQDLYGRNWMKARNMDQDPTQIREKLYADILSAMGVYANQANYARIYINKDGYGTFNLVDDVIEYSYINAVFYGSISSKPASYGPLYDGGTGGSFDYATEQPNGFSSWTPNPSSPEDSSALAPVALALSNLDVTNDAQVQNFTTIFDVDHFLRCIVLEYLTGSWDAYWMMQSNDGAYQDPLDNKWYYIPQGKHLRDNCFNIYYIVVSITAVTFIFPRLPIERHSLSCQNLYFRFRRYLWSQLGRKSRLCQQKLYHLPYHIP